MPNKIIETIDTKITDKWGVIWDEMETVRDFLQNFYDANPIEDISIRIKNNSAVIYAPAEFDYNELHYLGSDKANDSKTIGQYGEGFKASVVNALRNWNLGVEVIISDRKLRFYFKKKKIGGTEKRVVFCDISEVEKINGSKLMVSNCSQDILDEFQFGLNHFFHDSNSLLGEQLAESYGKKDIAIYKSKHDYSGYVFYKNLLRAKIDTPIVIVCHKEYKTIDKEINHDRDRKAFNDEVLSKLLKLAFNRFSNYELKSTIYLLKDWWICGHKILSIIANTRGYRPYPIDFPENYYAKESQSRIVRDDIFLKDELLKVKREFEDNKYHCCPNYMSKFGMKSPDQEAKRRIEERREKLNNSLTRSLTLNEKHSIEILAQFIKELSEDLYDEFENAKYTVGENDEIIGELKEKRDYRKQHVFLNSIFFTFPFNDALAILLHEWAHIYGGDGSRTFSDALTSFISMILNNEKILEKLQDYTAEWNKIQKAINNERKNSKSKTMKEILSTKSKEDLINLLIKIPEKDIRKMMEK